MSQLETDPFFRLQRLYDAGRLLITDSDRERAEIRFDEEIKLAGDFLDKHRQTKGGVE